MISLIPRSRRRYEIVMAVCPGSRFDGIVLGVNNPDGENEYVCGKGKFEHYLGYLDRIDAVVLTYLKPEEHAIAQSFLPDLKDMPYRVMKYTHDGFTTRLPTRVECAEWALHAACNPKGVFFTKKGRPLTVEYLEKMTPKAGVIV